MRYFAKAAREALGSAPMQRNVRHSACPHDCPDTCAMLVTVKGGRAVRVAGDPEHPFTQGFLCAKVNRYVERTYHADRLQTPIFVLTDLDTSSDDTANALGLLRNGRAIVAGASNARGSSDFALVRYNADGSVDTGFGTGGRVTTDFNGQDDETRGGGNPARREDRCCR